MATDTAWTVVPRAIAERHPLYGVGGWLWLVVVSAVLSPIRIVTSLVPLYTSIDYGAVHPLLTAFIVAEVAVNTTIVLWSLGNLFLLFNKHPLFPRSLAGLLGFSAVFVPLDALVAKGVMDAIEQPMPWDQVFDAETIREVGRSVVGAAIWIPYAFISRRVNITYLNRVRADDPLLRENTAEVF